MPKILIRAVQGMLHSEIDKPYNSACWLQDTHNHFTSWPFNTTLFSRWPMNVRRGYGGCKTATTYRMWKQGLWRQMLRRYRTVRNNVSVLGHSRHTRMRGLCTLQLQVDTIEVMLHFFFTFSGLVRITDLEASFFIFCSPFVIIYDCVQTGRYFSPHLK
jgi:hypothetical protein